MPGATPLVLVLLMGSLLWCARRKADRRRPVRVIITAVVFTLVVGAMLAAMEVAIRWDRLVPNEVLVPFGFLAEQVSYWDAGRGEQVYPIIWGLTNAHPDTAQQNTLISLVAVLVGFGAASWVIRRKRIARIRRRAKRKVPSEVA